MEEVKIGGIYRHYKNKEYKVLAVAAHTETLEKMVVYQALYGEGKIWTRPLVMFLETVMIDGKEIPRFALKGE